MLLPREHKVDKEKSFLDHLDDLRWLIIYGLIVFTAAMLVSFPLIPRIWHWLTVPLFASNESLPPTLSSLEVSGAFFLMMQLAAWTGLIISAPIILILVGRFIFPALKAAERKVVLYASCFSVALFLVGVLVAYYLTLPVALEMMWDLHRWLQLQPVWTAPNYYSFAINLLLAFGLLFQLPVIILVLGSQGIIRSRQLVEKRRHAIVGLFVIAMVLSPSTDAISLIIMALPLVLLYEICVALLRYNEKRRAE